MIKLKVSQLNVAHVLIIPSMIFGFDNRMKTKENLTNSNENKHYEIETLFHFVWL